MIQDTAVETYSGVLSCFNGGKVDHAIAPCSAGAKLIVRSLRDQQ